jgi:hypothetical protein
LEGGANERIDSQRFSQSFFLFLLNANERERDSLQRGKAPPHRSSHRAWQLQQELVWEACQRQRMVHWEGLECVGEREMEWTFRESNMGTD